MEVFLLGVISGAASIWAFYALWRGLSTIEDTSDEHHGGDGMGEF